MSASKQSHSRRTVLCAAASIGAICAVAAPGMAWAQANAVEEVVVTAASRINKSGFTAPTPLTVVGVEELKARAAVSLAEALNTTPSFSGSTTPSTTALNSQGTGGNYLNLRGLGTSRTLVLVDGRRHVPTQLGGSSVDLNVIPAALVERVEVVTGGASAAWGSDAVAGVVNVILRRSLEGLEGDVQVGRSHKGDNDEYKVMLAWGTRFADDRGNFIIGGELSESKGVLFQTDRDWSKQWGIVANPGYAPGNGQFRQVIVPDFHMADVSRGGLIVSGPLRGTQFLAGSVPAPFQFGQYLGASFMSGGDGVHFGDIVALKIPVERHNLYAKSDFQITETLRAFAEGSYSYSHSANDLVPTYSLGATTIRVDNAFLPASIRSQMQNLGLASFQLGRADYDMPLIRPENENTTRRFVVGLEGEVSSWDWQASYQYGQSRYYSQLHGNRIKDRYAMAVDSVVDPASGRVVCRSTLTSPGNGCVPMNILGAGSASAESIAYTTATQIVDARNSQQSVELSAQGDIFTLPAGAVSLAVGGHYREEELQMSVDALSAASAFLIGNTKANQGKMEVKEAFGEIVVPLLADMPLVKSLEFNGAARRTEYSTSGGVTTWKAGLSYEINDDLRLRGTRSRDIRAPNLSELYNPSSWSIGVIFDPRTNQQHNVPFFTTGNPNLAPEKADTTTVGLVYQPSWLTGLRASIDYYDIKVEGAISTVSGQSTVDRCQAGAQDLCNLIVRNASGVITEILRSPVNLSRLSTNGVDIEATYRTELSQFSDLPGTATFRLLATYVGKRVTNDGITSIDRAGDVGSGHGGVPHWKVNAAVSYQNGPLSLNLDGRYIGGGKYDNTYGPFDINDNTIPSVFYLNAGVRYTVLDEDARRVEIYGNVQNLLDKDPPVNVFNFSQAQATNQSLYDVIGRSYMVGVRFKY